VTQDQLEVILGLLVAIVVLVTVARRLNIAYPILLVVGGLALGFVPGLPTITLPPELVLLFFLPPLLYWEALNAPYRDLRANLRSIALLSVGLVLATMLVVAAVAHAAIGGLSWATAFMLGAIVAPTDAVAVEVIAERLRLPRRLVTVLEGESLANDATALVAYVVAVNAVASGDFSLGMAAVRFVLAACGGIAIGLAAGWAIGWVRRHLDDPLVENTISLLSGFAAYVPAQAVGASGVLAVVAAGLYLGRQAPRYIQARTRRQAEEVWQVVVFLLNCLIFLLVGLQLHPILAAISHISPATLIWYAVLISLAVIVVRLAWVFPGAYLSRLPRMVRRGDPFPPWQNVVIAGWAGMRGGVSLAAALALPVATHTGAAFPQRALIIFLTFGVILTTLVVQGLSLPWLIRRLGVTSDGSGEREEVKAHLAAARAARDRLDALGQKEGAPGELIAHMRAHYDDRVRLYKARYHGIENAEDERYAALHRKLQRKLLLDERSAIIELRDRGVINDEAMRRVQRDLDLEELLLEDGTIRP
jgi:monovalent cation/hydrogen antiporter